ncbi:MAG: hypothetical protein JNL38_06535 [Myxococcales bacterium]|nr:hypothetical protein [Myxococcales bacterium]
MAFRPARLFHAVVVSGAALVGCQPAPTREVPMAAPDGDAAAPPVLPAVDATGGRGANEAAAPGASAPPSRDAGAPSPQDAGARPRPDGGCPPGSERPVPPCYYIR